METKIKNYHKGSAVSESKNNRPGAIDKYPFIRDHEFRNRRLSFNETALIKERIPLNKQNIDYCVQVEFDFEPFANKKIFKIIKKVNRHKDLAVLNQKESEFLLQSLARALYDVKGWESNTSSTIDLEQ